MSYNPSAGGGGGVTDGDKGDVVVSSTGSVWTVDAGAITTTKMGGDVTTAGKALLTAANAGAQRTALGLGTAATSATGDFAAASHTHAQSDVTNLVADLAGKAAASHTHAAADITSGTLATARLASGSANSTTFLRGDQTWAAPTASVTAATVETALPLGFEGAFTITDAAITATSAVLCWQAPGPYTGKGTRADEAAMQPVSVVSVEPATGSARVRWQTPPSYTQQVVLPNGKRFAAAALNEQMLFPTLIPCRVGRVRGNVKFSYLVLG
jgi:hypothetical protein